MVNVEFAFSAAANSVAPSSPTLLTDKQQQYSVGNWCDVTRGAIVRANLAHGDALHNSSKRVGLSINIRRRA